MASGSGSSIHAIKITGVKIKIKWIKSYKYCRSLRGFFNVNITVSMNGDGNSTTVIFKTHYYDSSS
jgi:hypothetical protein